MSHFTLTTFLATTATALAPFLIAYNMPPVAKRPQQQQLSHPSSIPKPQAAAATLAALRSVREQPHVGSEFSLI